MLSRRTVQIARLFVSLLIAGATATWTSAEPQGPRSRQRHTNRSQQSAPSPVASLPCGDLLAFQVRLDRQGFSPGQIEPRFSANLARALTAFQSNRGLAATGEADCDTWRALGSDESEPATVPYELGEADVEGPFTPQIPADLERQATLPVLEYRSPLERLAERFHVSPASLRSMNGGIRFTAGQRVLVPAVAPFDPAARPAHDPAAEDITVQVTREESALRVIRPDGSLVMVAPVSSGSVHDPLPAGDWMVKGVSWRPSFHYNPMLFWDANPAHQGALIKPGPNNPVGVVWIDLNLEHYGLHGTPEPGRIGASESHGCVRLTNWDAARVASLVKPGTPVLFR